MLNGNSVLASITGGYDGNGGRYTAGNDSDTDLISLATSAYINDLVVNNYYKLTLRIKKGAAWNGGNVTINVNGNTKTVTLTSSYVLVEIEFQADAVSASISISCASGPTTADVLWMDNVELKPRETISCEYYGLPNELTSDSDEPDEPLDIEDTFILNAAMIVIADDLGEDKYERLYRGRYERSKKQFIKQLSLKGKFQNHASHSHSL